MGANLFGVNITDLSFEDAVEKGLALINSDGVSQVVTINPEMFDKAERDSNFKEIIENAELVIPDGIGVEIALRIKGHNIKRIAGIDYAKALLIECANNNLPVAIIGAKKEVISKAVDNLKTELSNLNIVYYHDGYYSDEETIQVELKNTNPKLVLVALGSPKQEYFIYNAKKSLSSCLMIGIGGSLDVWSGTIKRAPVIFRKLGTEWLYRTITQPQRLKRIFPAIPLFLIKVILSKKD